MYLQISHDTYVCSRVTAGGKGLTEVLELHGLGPVKYLGSLRAFVSHYNNEVLDTVNTRLSQLEESLNKVLSGRKTNRIDLDSDFYAIWESEYYVLRYKSGDKFRSLAYFGPYGLHDLMMLYCDYKIATSDISCYDGHDELMNLIDQLESELTGVIGAVEWDSLPSPTSFTPNVPVRKIETKGDKSSLKISSSLTKKK